MAGMVYLVGAGPGDYRLISLKAVDCLKMAEVVVYDRLADPRILQWAPEEAEYIYVGKASSNHTMKQEDINQLLVDKAQEGKVVVRLKGGDPFVFGRGGEEALLLRENHLPFEIVPGITSAISVPAYAGIPVTHRAVATSFAVVTGHEDPTKSGSNMRWDKLSTGVDTLVFLMGVANLPHITEELMRHGRSADTPAAVIRWGTKAEQRVLETTVGTAAEDVAKAGLKPPAIFIVGEVVKLRESLKWFDDLEYRPLFGKTVLVTRARSQASKLTAALEALGAGVIEAPAIELRAPEDNYKALDEAISHVQDYHWLIFTSTNGVEHFFARLFGAGKDVRALGYAKVAAIGSATAEKLREYGIRADVVPQEFRAEGILEALKGKLPPHVKILLPRAQEAREILPEKLREQGHTVDVVPVYQTVTAEDSAEELKAKLAAGEIDLVTFTSSSTVINLLKLIGGKELLNGVKLACIGPVTAETARNNGLEPDMEAEEYTINGLVKVISEYFKS
ncbi:MAG: uroporphyrinogen-III C-methyltransferase [Selenomonas sp.]|nr:uroporphyrinogen-III C-methyltransferase [Selenomonas sp.]